MRKAVIFFLLFIFLVVQLPLYAKNGSLDARYVGGTVSNIKNGTDGKVSTNDEKVFTFDYKDGQLAIPYDKVNSLEYGQKKAGRRQGLTIALTPIALLSKKRKHFLTLNYVDQNNKQQAVVFELGKDAVRVTLSSLEARTGRDIEYSVTP